MRRRLRCPGLHCARHAGDDCAVPASLAEAADVETRTFLAVAPSLLPRPGMAPGQHRERGFTLIELMVVIAIVAVLAAIAIPSFTGRQGKAYDARVMQDARAAANGQEAYFTDTATYYTGDCSGLPGVNLSEGVTCTTTAQGLDFSITTSHPRAPRSCTWSSNTTPNLICS